MSQSICILSSYDRNLTLKVNTNNYGYNQLKYYFNDNKEDIQTILIDNPLIEIERLNIGKYIFYAYNTKTNMISEELEIYIPGSSYQDRVDRLWSLAKVEDNEYNNTLKRNLLKRLRHNPEYSLLYIVSSEFSSIKNPEDFERELFFKLIVIQEKYENLESSNYNRSSNGFNLFKNNVVPKLILTDIANTIKIYKVLSPTNKILSKIYRNINEETDLYFDENNFYEIHVMNNSDLILVFRHFQFDYENTLLLWNTIDNFINEYEDITEDFVSISPNSKMNSTENRNYLVEKSMFPINDVVPRLEVTYPHYDRAVELKVNNVSYMNTSDHKFYISGKDIEFIDENINNKFIEINNEYNSYSIEFNPVSNMIDKEALLYITDENDTIVSRISRVLFSEDDYENYNDYYEKIRQLELGDYTDNLIKYISNTCPQYYSIIQDTMYSLLEDSTVNISNILKNTIALIDNKNDNINRDLIYYEILKNHFINTNYDSQFFSDKGFTWEPYTYKLITEESQNGYVLCILAKENGEEEFSEYYIHSFKDRAIELMLNRYGKYIVYAISENDYKYSGFFYLNTNNNFYKSYLLNQGVR